TICNALRALTKTALEKVRSVVLDRPWLLVYDNINISNREYDQRGNNRDTFENGTTATIVIGEDLGPPRPPTHAPRAPVTLMDLLPNAGGRAHFRAVTQYTLVDVLQRHFDVYHRGCSIRIPALSPLPVRRTETFPLPSMKIDQSTVEGNLEIIEKVTQNVLKLPDEWFDGDKRVIVAGDQLTVCRVSSLKSLRGTDVTRFTRMTWAVPLMQLFHLQMLLCSTILRTHYGSVATPGSLAFYIAMLERKRVNLDTPNHHAADEILRNTFDAMVRQIWETELETENLDKFATDKFGIDELQRDTTGLADFISKMSETIRQKYLINTPKLTQQFNNADVNALLFIRDMNVYIELSAAIKAGDVQRIEEVVKLIAVMFQAGGIKNYAKELLRLIYGFSYAWTEQEKAGILSSWLVNTKGKDNSWLPADLYQEHNNLLIKTVHAAKGSNMSWEVLADSVSMNIHLFSKISQIVEAEYDALHYNSSYHSTVSAEADIGKIIASLREHNILANAPRKDQSDLPIVRDLIEEGMGKLAAGANGLADFLKRMDHEIINRDADVADEHLELEQTLTEHLELERSQAEQFISSCLDLMSDE
ncbi:hypothetical protein BGZ98_009516, partial [Dissophora globulifera]